MSEQELTKWKNKFKLYKTLHHDFVKRHEDFNFQDMCSKCLHAEPHGRMGVSLLHCPKNRLVTSDFETVHFEEDRVRGLFYCVEWIRYV